jgi:PAS domain S-box-containing protein
MPDQRKKAKPHISDILDSSFRVLAETSPTGIYLTDSVGKCLYVNPAWCKMAGLMPKEAFGDGWIKALHPDDSVRIFSEWNNFVKGNIPWKSEYRFKDASGNIIWVYGTATLLKRNDGSVEGVIGVNIDITGRKKAEEVVKQSEEKFRLSFMTGLDAFYWATLEEGRILEINEVFETIFGYPRDEVLGRTSLELNLFHNPKDRARMVAELKANGFVRDMEFGGRNKDGNLITFSLSARPTFLNGQMHILGVIRDITASKKTEDELRKSNELYKKLNQHLHDVWESEKSQIAMNLHDDLGQRITGLYMDIAWIKSRIGVQSAAVRKKLNDINTSLNEIIEGIKDLSFSLMPAILSELGIVAAITSHLIKFEAQSGIKCSFDYDPEEIAVEEGLSLVLYRVFQESLTNVARHSQANHAMVILRMLNNNIELTVKDDGIGIEKAKIDSLNSMGISAIKARVRLVNGCVQFIGKKDSGTIIKVKVPLNKGKQR